MVTVPTSQGDRQVKVGGRIDRLDAITDKETGCRRIRVIDYKTGAREISRPVADIADIFDPLLAGDEKHTDYYLQSMLYSLLVRNDTRLNPENTPVSPSLIFIQRSFSDNYDPTIVVGKEKVLDIKHMPTNTKNVFIISYLKYSIVKYLSLLPLMEIVVSIVRIRSSVERTSEHKCQLSTFLPLTYCRKGVPAFM